MFLFISFFDLGWALNKTHWIIFMLDIIEHLDLIENFIE
ncbi:hypothetical protein KCO_03832 [Pectobacterium brasiliense ICMP 19477]|nr:hypothetical protein KCO_03832 [Pectobacterium brasiliense ICMP 19477]